MKIRKLYKRLSRRIDHAYGCSRVRRNGFWFVDIPRTSSSSIRSELGMRFGKAYGKSNMLQKEHALEQIFPDHLPAIKMRNTLGKSTWDRIFTFTIVRNPWDRIYSIYNYRLGKNGIPDDLTFRDYVLAMDKPDSDTGLFRYHGFRYGSSDYVLDENNEIIVDHIARYEKRTSFNKFTRILKK